VPVVDYGAVLADGPSAIPTQCAPVAGVPPELRNSAPSVTAFAGDFRAPRSWRASLGVTRRFWERFTFGVEGAYAWGVAQYGVRDVNLDARPEFALADEGGRPVYVPAAAIIPANGASNLGASRVDPRFSQVFEVNSRLRSRNAQLVTSLNGFTSKGSRST
jgi:hypothetical protein